MTRRVLSLLGACAVAGLLIGIAAEHRTPQWRLEGWRHP